MSGVLRAINHSSASSIWSPGIENGRVVAALDHVYTRRGAMVWATVVVPLPRDTV